MSLRVYFEEYGSPTVLRYTDDELPGPGQARIVNRAIAVNPIDCKVVAGLLKDFRPIELPAVPGNEAAGTITAVGPGVDGFAVGDEVIWYGFTGACRAEGECCCELAHREA